MYPANNGLKKADACKSMLRLINIITLKNIKMNNFMQDQAS